MGTVFCRQYQLMMKAAMGAMRWRIPDITQGPGKVTEAAGILKNAGKSNPLIVTGKHINADGLLDEMTAEMERQGLDYIKFMGKADPDDKTVSEGVTAYLKNGCDSLLAFGGGSHMDCAKAVGAVLARPGKSISELQGLMKVRKEIPFLLAVPTTAGTGSETTIAAVITDSGTGKKAPVNDMALMPDHVILDPCLTLSLSPEITAQTGMDALCHAIEAYINHTYNSKLENRLCKDAISYIDSNLLRVYENGSDVEGRQAMQRAAFSAGRALTRGCVGYAHAIGHGVGSLYGMGHGMAVGIILPHVLEGYGPKVYDRLAELADVCGIQGRSNAKKAKNFIGRIRELKTLTGIPEKLPHIKDEDTLTITDRAMEEAHPLYPVPEIWNRRKFKEIIMAMSE